MRLSVSNRLAAVGLGLVLLAAGCSADDGGAGSSTGAAKKQLTVVGYGGSVQDVQRKTIDIPFGEANGVKMLSDGPPDYAKIQAQVESKNVSWDVVQVEPFWALQQCGKLLTKLDLSALDTANLPAEGITPCAVPLDIFTYVLMYDKDKFANDPPTSWADFFDLKKFPGKRGVMNYAQGGGLEVALLGDGVDRASLYPLDVERGLKKLSSIRPEIAFFDTGAQLTQQMESHEVAMSIAWSARGYDAHKNGANYEPVWKDHLNLVDQLVVPIGANVTDAMKYLEYVTSVKGQEAYLSEVPLGTANAAAKPSRPEGMDAFVANATPERAKEGIYIDQQWWADNYDAAVKAWTKWSAG